MPNASQESRTRSFTSQIERFERLRRGRYYADFCSDVRVAPPVFHCLIQCEGSSDVLFWTQHRTLEEAIAAAAAELQRFAKEDRQNRAA